MNKYLTLDNIKINILVFKKIINNVIENYDSFDILTQNIKIEDNNLKIYLLIKFKLELKTYKAVIEILENELYNNIHYFSSKRPRIQIRIK